MTPVRHYQQDQEGRANDGERQRTQPTIKKGVNVRDLRFVDPVQNGHLVPDRVNRQVGCHTCGTSVSLAGYVILNDRLANWATASASTGSRLEIDNGALRLLGIEAQPDC